MAWAGLRSMPVCPECCGATSSSGGVDGCVCKIVLRDQGWPNLLVTMTSNADRPCDLCFPMERTYYFNGPPEAESGFYEDPEPGGPAIPPDCHELGGMRGTLDCGGPPPNDADFCNQDGYDEVAQFLGEGWGIRIMCSTPDGVTGALNCFQGRLTPISCDPLLLRGTFLCIPNGFGTPSGCCGDELGFPETGCIDVEVTLAP